MITRNNNQISFMCSGFLSDFGKIDLRFALDSYGFLIGRFETISPAQFIKRIRAYQSSSVRRNHLIKIILLAARPHDKPIKNSFYKGLSK